MYFSRARGIQFMCLQWDSRSDKFSDDHGLVEVHFVCFLTGRAFLRQAPFSMSAGDCTPSPFAMPLDHGQQAATLVERLVPSEGS
jgi:hypothetical protein